MTSNQLFPKPVLSLTLAIVLYIAANSAQVFAQSYMAGNLIHGNVDADSPTVVRATPLNGQINGPFQELKPTLSPCGNRLYFSRSQHPGNTNGELDYEDIWFSEVDPSTGEWSHPARLPGILNNAGPNFINNVSVTGDTLIMGNQYLKKGKMRAGISYSVRIDGEWTSPVPIVIEDDYNVSEKANSFVSLKNGVIIRAVQRAETFGDRDLYVSFWDGESASQPVNMGSVINTSMEESSPFLAADGKTLYFASRGHDGLGGLDIWVSKRLDDTWTNWSTPENLGPAVNGPMDDAFFTISHCGNFAIFSKQVTVHNFDIYRIPMDRLTNDGGAPPSPDKGKKSAIASL